MKKLLSIILSISLLGNNVFATNTTTFDKKTPLTNKTKITLGLSALGVVGLSALAIVLGKRHLDQKNLRPQKDEQESTEDEASHSPQTTPPLPEYKPEPQNQSLDISQLPDLLYTLQHGEEYILLHCDNLH